MNDQMKENPISANDVKTPPKSDSLSQEIKKKRGSPHPFSGIDFSEEGLEIQKQRFLKYVTIASDDGCWIWSGGRAGRGYGRFSMFKRTCVASRAAWILFNKEDPKDLLVCHHCDNPPCVNPKHLFLGTHKDNTDDNMKKGRHAMKMGPNLAKRGEESGKSKLTEKQVLKIRSLQGIKEGPELAEMFKVDQSNIYQIFKRRTWKHI